MKKNLFISLVSYISIIGYETTGQLLADIAPTYFVAISALVAAFFGADALVKRKK